MFESESFKDLLLHMTHFPMETQCPKCGLYDLTREVIDQIAETSGGSEVRFQMRLSAARCQCKPPHRAVPETQTRLPYKESE